MKSDRFRPAFPRAMELTYLDTAAEGLPVATEADALLQYFRDKSLGTPGRKEFHRVEGEALTLAAELLGTDAENVTFLGSASEAMSVLANSIEWRTGDEVIISDLEFPSNVLSWLRLRDQGVKVVVVGNVGGALRWEDVESRLNERTRLISLSLVSYKTGAYLPFVPQLAEAARRVDAVLAIDATQALGRCPLSLEGVDYLYSSSFKWMMGPHGLGLVYVSPEYRAKMADPSSIGWYSVPNVFTPDRYERYELKAGARSLAGGMPNFPALYGIRQSLRFLLDVGVDSIWREMGPLVEEMRAGLAGLGCQMLTPEGEQYASGIAAFSHERAEAIGAALAERDVIVWAGDGRVRASLHLYNNAADVARYLEVLREILA